MVKKGITKATKGKSTKENAQSKEEQVTQKPEKNAVEAVKNNETQPENEEAAALTKRELLFRQKLFDSIGINLPEHYDESFVKTIYEEQIKDENKIKIQNLEVIGYLENYLWKYFTPTVSLDHLLSILTLLNERSSHDDQSAPSFTGLLHSEEQKFPQFVDKLIDIFLENEFEVHFTESFVCFLKTCVQAIDHKFVRNSVLRYFSLPIWYSISSYRRDQEFENAPNLKNAWKMLDQHRVHLYQPTENQETKTEDSKKKKRKRGNTDDGKENIVNPAIKMFEKDSQFIPKLLTLFYEKLALFAEQPDDNLHKFLVRNLELFIDLLSQYATRKYFIVLLEDSHFIVRVNQFPVSSSTSLFSQLVKQIEELIHFPVNTQDEGQLIEIEEVLEAANSSLNQLQTVAFQLFPEQLKDLIFSSLGQLQKADNLNKFLCLLSLDELLLLAKKLHLIEPEDESNSSFKAKFLSQKSFFLSVFIDKYCWNNQFLKEKFQVYSLYPTEENLFDEFKIPFYSSSTLLQENPVLAVPKLNLQFLALEDYLWKNFQLFQSENYYSIREDIVDAVKRSGPKKLFNNSVMFHGWSRNALPILTMSVDEVDKPKIGEVVPAKVISTITIDISRFSGAILDEWESLGEHDIVFLISFDSPSLDYTQHMEEFEREKTLLENGSRPHALKGTFKEEEIRLFLQNYGVKYIRGAEIFEYRDEVNNILSKANKQTVRQGTKRNLRVKLDPVQYYHDIKQGNDCYDSFHLLVKRDPRENNFKAILETIKNLYLKHSLQNSLPSWMKNPLLGIGDTKVAHFRSLESDTSVEIENFVDTFLDVDHIKESFSTVKDIVIENSGENSALTQPFRLEITRSPIQEGDLQSYYGIEKIVVRPYQLPSRGPYPENARQQNSVRFTSQQVQAIRSGMRKGLSVVVGPPGTGKTDVTVQLISNLYHNYPNQRILVVTHSNAALNDIFEKIMKKDIHPRHLIRLGSGEADLRDNTTLSVNPYETSYSKQGRVDWCLMRRIQLLAQVQRLSLSLEQLADNGSNCETASFFYSSVVAVKITKFRESLKSKNYSSLQEIFPFKAFFQDVTDLFSSKGDEKKELEMIESCLNYVENIFAELADYRPLEFLRTGGLRCDYLLMNQARLVAMTCTHAAIMRDHLVELGFQYDSLIMEEAAQILEIETFIPMCLQKMETTATNNQHQQQHRLKRIVLLGDHYQLPPIIQNQSLQQICHFHQSMFTRLLRLGYPSLSLTHQGRSRKELVSLFNWRYAHSLTHLPNIETLPEYSLANPGFYYSYQFIHVPYYQQKGESLSHPSQTSSFQNLGEAEYVVAVFQYMCLLGYPSEKISILTTYQAQKQLIYEILKKRCLLNHHSDKKNIFGYPKTVTTIDKFQGQQNDYILVSLVRTDHIGYLKDIHRLIVFLSRARYGLYVFGHHSLFEKSATWLPILSRFDHHPNRLTLVAGESYQNRTRMQSHSSHHEEQDKEKKDSILEIDDVSTMGILVYQMTQQAQAAAGQKK